MARVAQSVNRDRCGAVNFIAAGGTPKYLAVSDLNEAACCHGLGGQVRFP
jgi:hypothetical protein